MLTRTKHSAKLRAKNAEVGLTWCHGELPLALQDDLAVVIHGRKHPLLEEDDILLVQAKVVMPREEVLGGLHRPAAGHDVPEGSTAVGFVLVTS